MNNLHMNNLKWKQDGVSFVTVPLSPSAFQASLAWANAEMDFQVQELKSNIEVQKFWRQSLVTSEPTAEEQEKTDALPSQER